MSVFAPLRHPAFRLLTAGRAVDVFGNAFAPVALAFAVLDLTHSAGDLGLVVGTRTLMNVLFILFGGVLADRLPRHLLMVGSCAVAWLTQAAVASVVLTHTATIPLLMGLSAINGVASAIALPASAAILAQTVPAEIRQQGNALNRMSLNAASIVGAPLAGLLVASLGPGWGIAVDSATFLVAGACFAFVRVPTRVKSESQRILSDLRVGWIEFRSRQWLWVVVAAFCVVNAAWGGTVSVLGPTVADATFGRRAWGFVLAAETVGLLLGGLIVMRLRVRRFLFAGCAACLLAALPIFTLGAYPHVWALLIAMLLIGVGFELFGVAWETTMQEHIPADKLARVYSYDMLGSFLAIPIGQVVVGPIAQVAGREPTLVGAGVLMTLAVLGMLASRDVRTLPHKLPEPAAAPVEESVA